MQNNLFPWVVSRVTFCPQCQLLGRPHRDLRYLIYSASEEIFRMRTCDRLISGSDHGFTPHRFLFKGIVSRGGEEFGLFEVSCLVIGCGVFLKKEPYSEKCTVIFREERKRLLSLPIHDAHALITFTDTDYKLDRKKYTISHKKVFPKKEMEYLNLRRFYKWKTTSLRV